MNDHSIVELRALLAKRGTDSAGPTREKSISDRNRPGFTCEKSAHRKLKGFFAAMGMFGAFLPHAGAQLATDQQQLVHQWEGGAIAPSWSSFGQSFRPTLSSIDWVEFVLRNESSPFAPISLSVSILNGAVGANGLEGSVLATSPAVSLTSANYAPLLFQFASSVSLVPGNTYVLRVNILTPNQGLGWWQAGETYAGGQMFQAPYESDILDGQDYVFREGTGRSVSWNNAGNGSWPTASNWTPNTLPTSSLNVNIANGGTCTLGPSTTGQASSVNLRWGSTLDVLGTLNCGGQVRVGDVSGSGTLYVRNGGTIAASGLVVSADAGSSGSVRVGDGGLPGSINAPISSVGPGEVRFNHTSSGHTVAQPLSGNLSVIHQAGTTTLSSTGSSYTGNTTINGGTLRITNNVVFNSPVSIAAVGALVMDIAQDVKLLQAVSGSGSITVAGNTRTARLAGNNAGFTGAFSLPNGTRGMMWSNAGSGSAAAAWDLSGQFAFVETPGAATVQLGALSGSNAATQLSAFGGTGLKTLEVGARNTNTTFAGVISDISPFGGGGANTVALRKIGSGTLTLSNNNSNTGGCTVNAGTLNVTGAVTNATAASGGTLGGTGTCNGTTVIQPGATLSPGGIGIGQISTTGPVTLSGAMRLDLVGPAPISGHDGLLHSGASITIAPTATLAFGTLSGAYPNASILFIVNNTGSGSVSGTFAGLPNGGTSGTPMPALSGLGGHAEWRIYYGADQATNSLTGGNDIALAPTTIVPCSGDLNADQQVTLSDLTILLGNFGVASGASLEDGDLDGDGDVDLGDLTEMLSLFGSVCP